MNNQRLKILLLGGTGAMGIHLSKILNNQGEDVYVTTRRERKGVGITYIQGNAHETAFLSDILRKYHFSVEFQSLCRFGNSYNGKFSASFRCI